MTELPNELRALLDLTRDAHDPTDPQARTRVRSAIATSLLISGGAASTSVFPQAAASNSQTLGALANTVQGSKVGWALLGSKLGTLAVGAVAAVGLTFAAYGYSGQPAASHPTGAGPAVQLAAPTVSPVAVPTEPAVAQHAATPIDGADDAVPSLSAATPAPRASAHKPQRVETLSAETGLLRSASAALAQGDELGAIAQLREHSRAFPNGSLREERDGLRAIAECSRDDAPSKASAKRFLQKYPSSLLGARVKKACAGE